MSLSLIDWLTERLENTRRLAATKTGSDREGWLEDGRYFAQAIDALRERDDLLMVVGRSPTPFQGHYAAVMKEHRKVQNELSEARAQLKAAQEDSDDLRGAVYGWLGYSRDRMPEDLVTSLQRVLGPLGY